MLQRGGVYPVMGPRRALTLFARYYAEPRGPRRRCSTWSVSGPWPRPRGGGCRGASSSGCRWRWPWWAGPRSSSWTSPRPGSTPRAGWPSGRSSRSCAGAGVCVVLTTHELPEAERLADEVVILAGGPGRGPGDGGRAGRRPGRLRPSASAPRRGRHRLARPRPGAGRGDVVEEQPGRVRAGRRGDGRPGGGAGRLARRARPPPWPTSAPGAALEDAYLEAMKAEAVNAGRAGDGERRPACGGWRPRPGPRWG